ncbi:hypothetical protein [Actimicrobium sp. CCI2.3]|uniref:hypothetical protein n=1 Tax=Actimicrobium sp. CCI2.3 TaxID=3048616 RepID=UPI002B24DB70|nr:hypothetical protein [Actimicrobium sp. CCI2.3]MEB0023798.1 hypothetical protein [Actimicrobium sp. CCI2.3]
MTFTVDISAAAIKDIYDIKLFVEEITGQGSADRRLEGIANTINQLKTLPFGGAVIPELANLGINDIRRKPSTRDHIVYKLDEANEKLTVIIVYPQKKDFQSILTRRILRM